MESTSPPQMQLPQPEKSFGSCASCGLVLCSSKGPKLLPCLHSLCKDCFSITSEIKECPVCHEKCELQDIVSNLLFAELFANPKDAAKCHSCENLSVTGWCVECQENFCTKCGIAHKRVELYHKHYVHTITPECPRPVFCPVHTKEPVYNYCLTCDQLICKPCQPHHCKHLLQYAHEAVGKQRKQIRRMVLKAQQQRLTVHENLTDLDVRLSDLEELQSQVRLEVKETVVRLCNVMVKKAAKLNKEIKVLCGKEREKLLERRSLLQKLKEKLDHVLTFTDKTLASQQHTVLLSCKRQIHHQLQGMLNQVVSPTPTVMDLSFHTNERHVEKVLKIFGRVVARDVPLASSNTRSIANLSPDLTRNCTLSAPTSTFQNTANTNTTSHSSSPSVSLPHQSLPSPKKHPVLRRLLSKKTANNSKHYSFFLSQNNKCTNYPGLKRAWSYHPYYPKDAHQSGKCSIKCISPQNRSKARVPSSKANQSTVASVSVQNTVSAPIFTDCSSGQIAHTQNGKGHQNNVDLKKRLRQQANVSSSAKDVLSTAPQLLSNCQKNKNQVEHSFTGSNYSINDLMISQGNIPSQLDQEEDRPKSRHTALVGSHSKIPSFLHCEPSKGFRSDLQTNKPLKNGPVSATIAAVGRCSVESQENASISRRVKGYHCNQSEIRFNGCKKRTQPCTLKHKEESSEHTIVNAKVKLNGLPPETMQTATQTKPPVIEKTEAVEESLAVACIKDSHSFPMKKEEDRDEKTFTKIRDDQGNIAILETLGRDWLPDVLVTRLSVPDFSSQSSTPAVCFLWDEEHKSFQICSVKEDDQCPALAPITSNTSYPLLVNKVRCAACKIKGKLFECCVCQRAFHRECHVPPVSVSSGGQWQCMLCSDLSCTEDLDLSGGVPCLNVNDQRKCEYLLLYLSCIKQSSLLYRPVKLSSQTSRYVDITVIRGRLLKKLTPYYLTPGEFVSDVWLLLHTLINSSKEPQLVMQLQMSFSEELRRVFGQSLHPSLLKDPFLLNKRKRVTE